MKTLQDIFNSDYDHRLLIDGVLKETFGDLFTEYEFAENFLRNADDQARAQEAGVTSVEKIGDVSGFDTPLSVFEITLALSVKIKYSRVRIQHFVRSVLYGESAFLIFHYEDIEGNDWRFSFLHVEKGNTTSAKRFTYLLGKAHKARTVAERFDKLKKTIAEQKHSVISDQVLFDAFSVEALTQEFYGKLYNWYLWAVDDRSKITFPNRTDTDQDDRENIQTKMLRLITRLMFVWFIKQKHLVPDSLFDTKTLGGILRTFDPQSRTEGNYYNAILQNLFFATLNQEIADRQFISDKIFQGKSDSYTIKNLYRDNESESWFTFPDNQKKQRVMQLFETVPYLNGGLFDCLDKFKYIPETQKWEADKFYDGFSSKGTRSPNGNLKYRAFVPNCFFFAPEHKEIIKEKIKGEYKDQEKDVCGLIELFGQYNFTVEENSPADSEISLDPELLGKVFENLLAAYNPETQDSARKSTGSYYTPREIVDYMVNESLIAYLTGKCGHQEAAIRALFDDHQPSIPDNAQKVASDLRNIRILDPACGSGAFPMGILLRITSILERLQPSDFNKYQTKIELIKNCIFGIDIQPIAMLICKLRFFISLICDSEYNADDKQNNFGITPLPSLETKFVAANSLLPAEVRKYDNDWTQDQQLLQLKQQLIALRKQALEIRSHRLKVKNQESDLDLCDKIEQYIISTATQPDQTKIEHWQREIEKAQAELPKYQHEQWVDETVAQQTLFEMGEPSMFRSDVNAKKRNELLVRIHNCEDAIARERGKSAPSGFAEAIRQVAHWNPYDQNTVSPFFDADWMFGVTEGFDIVIGNPPYVRVQTLNSNDASMAKAYTNEYSSVIIGNYDLYLLFMSCGLKLINECGITNYILPNKFLQATMGTKIRKIFKEGKKIRRILDFGTNQIFKNATTYTCIIFLGKNDKDLVEYKKFNNGDHFLDFKSIVFDNIHFCQLPDNANWSFQIGESNSIIEKIKSQPYSFSNITGKIFKGSSTGNDKIFLLDLVSETDNSYLVKSEIQSNPFEVEKGICRKFIYGESVLRYAKPSPTKLLLFPYHKVNEKYVLLSSSDFIKSYPLAFRYLNTFKDILMSRKLPLCDDNFFKYSAARSLNEYEQSKILIPDMLVSNRIGFDENGEFFTGPAIHCPIFNEIGKKINVKVFLGILNSKVFWYFISHTSTALRGDAYRLTPEFLNDFAFPQITTAQQSEIIEMVDEILSNPTSKRAKDLEDDIDDIVYKLYDLDDKEIAVVKGRE